MLVLSYNKTVLMILKKLAQKSIWFFLLISLSTNAYFIYNKYFAVKIESDDLEINVLELKQIPTFLRGYRAEGFVNTFVPTKNPFGGIGLNDTTVTAYYLDPKYTQMFGTQHKGLDLIPNQNYYSGNSAYFRSRVPVIFSTINGSVMYLYDEFGANYLVITNDLDNLRTLFVHIEASFVKTGDRVVAGQPIGIMGSTGKSTGKHLHYEVQTKNSLGNWINQNPINYITE